MYLFLYRPWGWKDVRSTDRAGKTEFLARSRDFETFRGFGKILWLTEPVEVWKDLHGTNLLELFYQDQKRLAFQMQSFVQLTLLKQNIKQERERRQR